MEDEINQTQTQVIDSRHEAIPGWDNNAVKKIHAVVHGTGALSNALCQYLAGLGVGNIKILDSLDYTDYDTNEYMLRNAQIGESRAGQLAKAIQGLNPNIVVTYDNGPLDITNVDPEHIDVLFETTNDPIKKSDAVRVAESLISYQGKKKEFKGLIVGVADDYHGCVGFYKPISGFSMFNGSYGHFLRSSEIGGNSEAYVDAFDTNDIDSMISSMYESMDQAMQTASRQGDDLISMQMSQLDVEEESEETIRFDMPFRIHSAHNLSLEEQIMDAVQTADVKPDMNGVSTNPGEEMADDLMGSLFNEQAVKIYNQEGEQILHLENLLMEKYKDRRQGNFTSGTIAALMCGEFRRALFSRTRPVLDEDDQPIMESVVVDGQELQQVRTVSTEENRSSLFHYNILSNTRFTNTDDYDPGSFELNVAPILKDKTVFVLGAGGIGTYVVTNLAAMGVGHIYIADDDVVRYSNLSRQWVYVGHAHEVHDNTQEYKVDVMAEVMREINPNVHIYPIRKRVVLENVADNNNNNETTLDEIFRDKDLNLMIGALDNAKARDFLGKYAFQRSIPLLDGSVDPFSGELFAYVPGESACMSCLRNLAAIIPQEIEAAKERLELAEKIVMDAWRSEGRRREDNPYQFDLDVEYRLDRGGCGVTPNASIVTSNALVGSLIAGESLPFLLPEMFPSRLSNLYIKTDDSMDQSMVLMDVSEHYIERVRTFGAEYCHNKTPQESR